MTDRQEAINKLQRWKENPCDFARECFDWTDLPDNKLVLDSWQIKTLEAFVNGDKNYIVMLASSGVGKSFCMALCILHFMLLRAEKGNYPKAIALSISHSNLMAGMFSEIAGLMQRSEIFKREFTLTTQKLYQNDYPENWCLFFRSVPATTDEQLQMSTLAGLHAKNLCYFVDESGGLPKSLIKAATQGISEAITRPDSFSRIVCTGNPLSRDGMLYEAWNDGTDTWHKIRITSDPLDPDRSSRVDINFAQEQLDKYGRDDAWCRIYLLGKFALQDSNSLIGISELDEAEKRHYLISDYGHSQRRIGCDVARYGNDATVISARQGLVCFSFKELRDKNGPEVSSAIQMSAAKWGEVDSIHTDAIGVGASVIDHLSTSGLTSYAVNFASKADNPERYFNKRAECIMRLVEWIKAGGSIPHSSRLRKELTNVNYNYRNGRILIESKEDIKKRIGFSTDYIDSLALTFSIVDQPKANEFEYMIKNRHSAKKDYDPLA